MKTVLFLIALSATSLAYAGEAPLASGTSATAPSAADDKGVKCEKKKELGSNLAKRVCTTESERVAAKEKAKADLQRLGRCADNENACRGDL
jgi:hypothetical protein